GLTLLDDASRHHVPGTYQVQAAIAAEHARAPSWESTDWARIRRMYDALVTLEPSPVVELSRAVAIAHHEGFERGLHMIDDIASDPRLQAYRPLHAARAELLRRLQRPGEARDAYVRAINCAGSEAERRLLQIRLESTAILP
ncbi:MAG: hypothetical protein M3R35_01440, partial [Candidatus Eremiobacteraeota bacterium]|nr:hypothetical protein [Candidatus Eremiobacteraeota bacterium]